MPTNPRPRTKGRGTNGAHAHDAPDLPPIEVETPVNEEALDAVTPTPPPQRPIIPKEIRFGVMTERGYVPKSRTVRVLCPLYAPDLELWVDFNTSIAYGFIAGNYAFEGDSPVEKLCRKLALQVPHFEGWNFFDPFKNEPIPPPDPEYWETYRPLVSASGMLVELGLWLDGPGLLLALDASMGNSSPA